MSDYIKDIRNLVGHQPIILSFAGGILANHQGQILLQQRRDLSGWGLPGGAMEFGESAAATCRREYLEETGLQVSVGQLLGVSTTHIQHYSNGDVAQAVLIFFELGLIGGRLNGNNDETLALQYFDEADLPVIFNVQHQTIIKYYFEKQRNPELAPFVD